MIALCKLLLGESEPKLECTFCGERFEPLATPSFWTGRMAGAMCPSCERRQFGRDPRETCRFCGAPVVTDTATRTVAHADPVCTAFDDAVASDAGDTVSLGFSESTARGNAVVICTSRKTRSVTDSQGNVFVRTTPEIHFRDWLCHPIRSAMELRRGHVWFAKDVLGGRTKINIAGGRFKGGGEVDRDGLRPQ